MMIMALIIIFSNSTISQGSISPRNKRSSENHRRRWISWSPPVTSPDPTPVAIVEEDGSAICSTGKTFSFLNPYGRCLLLRTWIYDILISMLLEAKLLDNILIC